MRSIHLLVIDPQNDFCSPSGSLFVPGADEDMKRLAGFLAVAKKKIDAVHVTVDSHNRVDISHPMWWKDRGGNHPAPFTVITAADVEAGVWTTTRAGMRARSLAYLKTLGASGRYPHVIWPEHCLIGGEGHKVVPEFWGAVQDWADRFALPNFVTKGSNPWTEHFSAVRAEVPDPADPSTQLNAGLISVLEQADTIVLAGEALSHCVANTLRDVADNFSDPAYVQKVVLLEDCCSNVTNFEGLGDAFVRDMRARGMRVTTTGDFLAQLQ